MIPKSPPDAAGATSSPSHTAGSRPSAYHTLLALPFIPAFALPGLARRINGLDKHLVHNIRWALLMDQVIPKFIERMNDHSMLV